MTSALKPRTPALLPKRFITLRDYQALTIDAVIRNLLAGRDVLLEAPTGSGKTLQCVVSLRMATGKGFTHALVAAPQRQIEEGFLGNNGLVFLRPNGSKYRTPIRVPEGFVRAARGGNRGSVREILAYLADPDPGYVLACTHAALTYLFRSHRDELPARFDRMILAIDEAHHVGAVGLSGVADEWGNRGGRYLGMTATPFGADGRDVKRKCVVHRRSQTQHMEEGYAPARVANEIVVFGRKGDKVSAGEFTGEKATGNKARQREIVKAMVAKWEADGRPKLIARVPPLKGGSGPLVAMLEAAFAKAGARVLNMAGTGKGRQNEVIGELRAEQKRIERGGFAASAYDVAIGVQRVTEGTDWPVCSHVYCLGIPGSLSAVIQLLGRATRKKGDDHPSQDLAKIVFFAPCAGGETLGELAIEHSRHALLTCVFMADYETGEDWVVTRAVRGGLGLEPGDDDEPKVDDAMKVPPDVYAEAKLHMAVAMEENPAITVGGLVEAARAAMPNADEDDLRNVAVRIKAAGDGRVRRAVQQRMAESIRIHPDILEARKAAFAAVVEEFRNETLGDAPSLRALAAQVHVVTGNGMRGMADRLRTVNSEPLTIDLIVEYVNEWRRLKRKNPTVLSGLIPGTKDTWATIDQALSKGHRGLKGGSSLARLIAEVFGDRNRASLPPLNRNTLRKWIADWRSAKGKHPNSNSGVIPNSDGETWGNVNAALVDGRRGLSGYKSLADFIQKEFGIRIHYGWRPLSVPEIVAWLDSHWQTAGEFPTRTSGEIPESGGETWAMVFSAAHNGRRGLAKGYSVTRMIADHFPDRPSRASSAAKSRWRQSQ